MKLTTSKLVQVIKEELRQRALPPKDIALGLGYEAASMIVNTGELASLTKDQRNMLAADIHEAVEKVILVHLTKKELNEAKFKVGELVTHDSDDLGTGMVVAVDPGPKGNILVKWDSGTTKHHRWALRYAKDKK